MDVVGLRRFDENLQVVQRRGVDKRHFTHPDDAHFGFLAGGGAHQFLEFGGDAEEERAVDFIYLHAGEHVEHLVVCGVEVSALGHVELFGVDADFGVLHHAAQE